MATKTDPLHFRKIRAPHLRKGVPEFELTAKTVIVGDPASGKTSRINALEMLLSGGASEVNGRSWCQDDGTLLEHLSHDPSQLTIWAEVSSQPPLNVTWHKEQGKSAEHVQPFSSKDALPLKRLREEIFGSDERAHRFFLATVCANLAWDQIEQAIPADLRPTLAVMGQGFTGSPVEKLLGTREISRKTAADKAKEAKGARQIAEAMGDVLRPTDDEIRVAREKADAVSVPVRTVSTTEGSALAAMKLRAKTIRENWPNLIAEHNQLTQDLAEIPERTEAEMKNPPVEAHFSIKATERVLLIARNGTGETCNLCGQATDPVAFRARAEAILAQLPKMADRVEDRVNALGRRAQIEDRLRALAEHFQATPSYLESLERSIAAAEAVASPPPSLPVSAISPERVHLETLIANRARSDERQRALDQVALLEGGVELAKGVLAACNKAVENLVGARIDDFIRRVQKWLPKDRGLDFALELSPFRMGKKSGDRIIGLSGQEENAVLLAIQIAMIEDAQPGLRVLIPPDRGTSPGFLRAQMDAVKDAPCQIVLQSTVLPEGRGGKVPGWTIIDLSPASRVKAAAAPKGKGAEGAGGNGAGAADAGKGGQGSGQGSLIPPMPPIPVVIE